MKRIALCVAALCTFTLATVYAEVKLDDVKCIMAPKNAAKADKSLDYKGAKIYFCCENCPKKFDATKNAAKANAQLVQTEQAKQGKCPLSGADIDKEKNLTVAGAKVYFCCDNCKGKAEKEKDDAQVELVFGDKAWDKGKFEVKK